MSTDDVSTRDGVIPSARAADESTSVTLRGMIEYLARTGTLTVDSLSAVVRHCWDMVSRDPTVGPMDAGDMMARVLPVIETMFARMSRPDVCADDIVLLTDTVASAMENLTVFETGVSPCVLPSDTCGVALARHVLRDEPMGVSDSDAMAQLRVLRHTQMSATSSLVTLVGSYLRAKACPVLVECLDGLSASQVFGTSRDGAPPLSPQAAAACAMLRCVPSDGSASMLDALDAGRVVSTYLRYADAVSLGRYQIGGVSMDGDSCNESDFRAAFDRPVRVPEFVDTTTPAYIPGLVSESVFDTPEVSAPWMCSYMSRILCGDPVHRTSDVLRDLYTAVYGHMGVSPPSEFPPCLSCVDVHGPRSELQRMPPVLYTDFWLESVHAAPRPGLDVVVFPPVAPLGGLYASGTCRGPSRECCVPVLHVDEWTGAMETRRTVVSASDPVSMGDLVSRVSSDYVRASHRCASFRGLGVTGLCSRVTGEIPPLDPLDVALSRVHASVRGYNPIRDTTCLLTRSIMRHAISDATVLLLPSFSLTWLVREWVSLLRREDLDRSEYASVSRSLFADMAAIVEYTSQYHPLFMEIAVSLGLVTVSSGSSPRVVFAVSDPMPSVHPMYVTGVDVFGTVARVAVTLNVYALALLGLVVTTTARSYVSGCDGSTILVPKLVCYSPVHGCVSPFVLSSYMESDAYCASYDRTLYACLSVTPEWGVYTGTRVVSDRDLAVAGVSAVDDGTYYPDLGDASRVCDLPPDYFDSKLLGSLVRMIAAARSLCRPHASADRLRLSRDLTVGLSSASGVDTPSFCARVSAALASNVLDLRTVCPYEGYTGSSPHPSVSRMDRASDQAFLDAVNAVSGPVRDLVSGSANAMVRRVDVLCGSRGCPFDGAEDALRVGTPLGSRSGTVNAPVLVDDLLYDPVYARGVYARQAVSSHLVTENSSRPFGASRVLYSAAQLLDRVTSVPRVDVRCDANVMSSAWMARAEYSRMLDFVESVSRVSPGSMGPSPEDVTLLASWYDTMLHTSGCVLDALRSFQSFARSHPDLVSKLVSFVGALVRDSSGALVDLIRMLDGGVTVDIRYRSALAVCTMFVLMSYLWDSSCDSLDWHSDVSVSPHYAVSDGRMRFYAHVLGSSIRGAHLMSLESLAHAYRESVCVPLLSYYERCWLSAYSVDAVRAVFGGVDVGDASDVYLPSLLAASYFVHSRRDASLPVSSLVDVCVHRHSMLSSLAMARAQSRVYDHATIDLCDSDTGSSVYELGVPVPRVNVSTQDVVRDTLRLLRKRDPVSGAVWIDSVRRTGSRVHTDGALTYRSLTLRSDSQVMSGVRGLVTQMWLGPDLVQDVRDTERVSYYVRSFISNACDALIRASAMRRVYSGSSVCRVFLPVCSMAEHADALSVVAELSRRCLSRVPMLLSIRHRDGGCGDDEWLEVESSLRSGSDSDALLRSMCELLDAVHRSGSMADVTSLPRWVSVMMVRAVLSRPDSCARFVASCATAVPPLCSFEGPPGVWLSRLLYVAGVAYKGEACEVDPVLPRVECPVHSAALHYVSSVLSASNVHEFEMLLLAANSNLQAYLTLPHAHLVDILQLVSDASGVSSRLFNNTLTMLFMINAVSSSVQMRWADAGTERLLQWYMTSLVRASRVLEHTSVFTRPLLHVPSALMDTIAHSYPLFVLSPSYVHRHPHAVRNAFAFLGASEYCK